MLGILCSQKEEEVYRKHFYSLFHQITGYTDIPVIVSALSGINFLEKTVLGYEISGDSIKPVRASLPEVMFNLSITRKRHDLKKLRALAEIENIVLVNETNAFRQSMFMQILSSNECFSQYLLPHRELKREDTGYRFPINRSFLIKPDKGVNLSNIIYVNQAGTQSEIYYCGGIRKCGKPYTEGNIRPFITRRKWLLGVPELITYNNQPLVIRVYIQKGTGGSWRVVLKDIYFNLFGTFDRYSEKLGPISLEFINYISNFIPGLGICFIDFILDTCNNPYFLNFGGWEHELLNKNRDGDFQKSLFINMLEFVKQHINK